MIFAPLTFNVDLISSLNLRPHIEFPPLPVPVGSPVYMSQKIAYPS
jgi:hypothetical protein